MCAEEFSEADCSVQANATSKLQVSATGPHSLERLATEPSAINPGHVKNVSQSLSDTRGTGAQDVSPRRSLAPTQDIDKVEGIVWVESKHKVVCKVHHSPPPRPRNVVYTYPSHSVAFPRFDDGGQEITPSCNRCGESLKECPGYIRALEQTYHVACFTCQVSIP